MMKSHFTRMLLVLSLAFLANVPAAAHVFLTSENLNESLKSMQRTLRDLRQEDGQRSLAQPLFELGIEAQELAELLNSEVRMHGREQENLLQLALKRCNALGVNIFWSPEHKQYFYDGDAFRNYLEEAPEGPHAAESSYRLIEYDFYHADIDDARTLRAAADRKRKLLQQFPQFRAAARVGVFLGIDYRDLWRLCRASGQSECASDSLTLARKQFLHLMKEYPDSDTAELASRLLQRIEDEASSIE